MSTAPSSPSLFISKASRVGASAYGSPASYASEAVANSAFATPVASPASSPVKTVAAVAQAAMPAGAPQNSQRRLQEMQATHQEQTAAFVQPALAVVNAVLEAARAST